MFETHRKHKFPKLPHALGIIGALVLFSGCASTPPAPTASLNAATAAIQTAQSDDASHYATAELDRARQSLLKAEQAVRAEEMTLAKRLADEATITAKLASARTEATKAEAINEDIKRGTAAMVEEIRRAGDQQ